MAIEAVRNCSVGFQQAPNANLKSQQSFTPNPEVDEEKSNATKYMIGATALAAVIGLGIAGYNGKLGKGIQKLLGGAEKAAEKGAKNAEDVVTDGSKKLAGEGVKGTEETVTAGSEKLTGEGVKKPAEEVNEVVKPKMRVKKRKVLETKSVVFKDPESGTDINGVAIKERLYLSNGKTGTVETIYDSKGRILDKRLAPKNNYGWTDYTIKEVVIKNGQKMTKKVHYCNGEIAYTDYCTYDPKNKLVKIVTQDNTGKTIKVIQEIKGKPGEFEARLEVMDNRIRRCVFSYCDGTVGGRNGYSYDEERIQKLINELNIPFEIWKSK